MAVNAQAGQLPDESALVDIDRLIGAYYDETPDPSNPAERVAFGTSGHRGTSFERTFTEAHVLAISEAVCRYRESQGIDGPLFLGRDTHALSEPAHATILEVLAARGVEVVVDAADGPTPTPAISHAILIHNRGDGRGRADGIVVTPKTHTMSEVLAIMTGATEPGAHGYEQVIKDAEREDPGHAAEALKTMQEG